MKNLLIFGMLIVGILIPIGIWMQCQAIEEGKKHFQIFNTTDIDSEIEAVRIAYKGTRMKLTDGREFVFYPLTDKNLNEGNIFNYTAEKGQRVKKKPSADTLYLYKGDQIFAYTFRKL